VKLPPPSLRLVSHAAEADSAERTKRVPPGLAREDHPGRGVGLSTAGGVVAELQAEAARHGVAGDVRPGVVEAMRAEIAAGRLGGPDDVERALDALLEVM
jgi:hypothetical protein